MFHTSNHHQATAVDGMRAYGLSGIELGHRAHVRRDSEQRSHQLRQVETSGHIHTFRQWLGDAMIRAGTGLAGDAARQVRRPAVQPKVSMS